MFFFDFFTVTVVIRCGDVVIRLSKCWEEFLSHSQLDNGSAGNYYSKVETKKIILLFLGQIKLNSVIRPRDKLWAM